MSSSFKPLGAGSSGSGKPHSGTDQANANLKAGFKPLGLSGSHTPSSVMASAHSSHSSHMSPPVDHHAEPAEPSPRVSSAITRLIRDGDRITHIEIQCGCGEVITLECGYAAG
jgi:hypothetical protein